MNEMFYLNIKFWRLPHLTTLIWYSIYNFLVGEVNKENTYMFSVVILLHFSQIWYNWIGGMYICVWCGL